MEKSAPQSRPKGFGMFPSMQTQGASKGRRMDEELPPGVLPNQFSGNRPSFEPMPFGQFNPYSGNNRNVPGGLTGGFNFPMSPGQTGLSSPMEGLSFTGKASSPGSKSTDSGRFLPTSSSSGSINTPTRMTPEHIIRTYSQESVGKLKIEPGHEAFDFVASDLTDYGEIGRGAFGSVNRMVHKKSRTEMAVKRIRSTVDEREQKRLLMDLDVVMRSSDCPYIVKFYGALFWEGDCWICMELMATSLDKFYRFVYHRQSQRIPEEILGKIAVATVKALDYLKEKLQIIHRDVKPSNILIDRGGNIKLCDFGISGHLVNSIARTRDAGCRPYMAPERIDTSKSRNGYDVRSDVWSLGITLIELATGNFPYPKWNNVFDQLTQVVRGEPPKLRSNINGLVFSDGFVNFINMMTIADSDQRPKYDKLLAADYLRAMTLHHVDVAFYFCSVLNRMTEADFMGAPVVEDGFRY
uniref:mitogen-activated protein kinase kinase n=1 Tax=Phallusia mammillata TaxID=59560 RepID=A0A6F9DJJ1_9ASCI|nr:MAPKK4 mitogen-activated protein kinase kinase 4 [Phallusia mammillata]